MEVCLLSSFGADQNLEDEPNRQNQMWRESSITKKSLAPSNLSNPEFGSTEVYFKMWEIRMLTLVALLVILPQEG